MSAKNAAPAASKAVLPLQNAKHESVLQQYIADPERVGYRCYLRVYPNSTEAAAKTGFSRLLRNADFAGRLAHLDAEITSKVVDDAVMSQQEVLAELSKLGRSSIKNVLVQGDDTADVIADLRDMAPEDAATIQELTVETYTEGAGEDARDVKRVRIKLHSKTTALSELRRHYEPQKLADPDGRALGTGAAEKLNEPLGDIELARRIAFALEQGARATPKPAKTAAAKKG